MGGAAALTAARARSRSPALTVAALALAACGMARADAQPWRVEGACRDGQPNGAYALKTIDGRLRAVGAFAKGRRAGTFLFWGSGGARLAVIPYDDDVKSGTVATWYDDASRRAEPRRKLEAPYVDNVLHGVTRSWHANGRPRGEYRYERGELAEARAWSETGGPLPEAEARRMAAIDRLAAEKHYASLEQLLADNAPHCG